MNTLGDGFKTMRRVMPLFPPCIVDVMSTAADKAIGPVLAHGSSGMKSPPRTEVGFVAAVTLGGIRDIASAWQQILAGIGCSLSVTGVFCHSSPQVRFRRAGMGVTTCELADLLVVIDWEPRWAYGRVACLIQAKMAAKAKRVDLHSQSSIRQLRLYQAWPLFSFVESVYGNDSFDLAVQNSDEVGTFGVIDRHFRNTAINPPIWTQHAPSPTPKNITTEPTLGAFLATMAGGLRLGFGRGAIEGGTDDWSKLVELLLRVTYAKTFRHQTTLGSRNPARGNNAIAFMLTRASQKLPGLGGHGPDWRPPFDGFEVIEDDNPGGISILHITFGEL